MGFVLIATIPCTLGGMVISKESSSRRAAERNKELRILWEPDLFVFIDESAMDERTVQRSHG